jgi:predicted lipoprotein
MVMRLVLLLLLLVGSDVSHPAAPTASEGPATAFDRSRMLKHVARQVMLATYTDFATATRPMPELATQFCAALSMGHLTALQQAWRQAVVPLKRSEMFRLGPAAGLISAVDFWPSRPPLIQKALADPQPITEEFIESVGAAARGVSALEYLLFDPEGSNSALITQFRDGLKGKRRCAYLTGIIGHLAQQAQGVATAWSPDGGNFVAEVATAGQGSATYPTAHKAVSDIVNRLLAALEHVHKNKLGRPLYGNGKSPWPTWVEAGRSGNSLANILENLQGLRAVYAGIDGTTNGLGFDDYLTALGSPLGERITQHIQMALAAVQAIPPPLRVAVVEHPQAVEAAYQALKVLLVLLKVDMTNLLGVTVDFSDNDGD